MRSCHLQDVQGMAIYKAKMSQAWWGRSWFFSTALLFVLVSPGLLLPDRGSAQVGLPPVIDPSGRSGLPPPVEQKKPLRPEQPPTDILPPVQPPPRDLREKGPVLRVLVRKIHVIGSTVLTQAELHELTAPYENREVTTEDLEELRRQITLAYIDKGYPNSGAVLPDQAVVDGTITMQVVEGRLSDVKIHGTKWFRPSYLRDRIELSAGPPFNMNPLRDRLQLLLQDDRVERLNAELKPGAVPGEAILDVAVQETNPVRAFVEYNNYINPTVGENQLRGTVAHRNFTGRGDVLSMSFGASGQASPAKIGVFPAVDASYAIPLNRYDTTFFAGYRFFKFKVVEDPFRPLDIKSETQIFTLSLRQPVYRTLNDEVAIALVGEYEQNANSLLGTPFDFVNGMKNGFGNVAALRFIQEWTHRTAESVFSVRSRFSTGVDVLGATVNGAPGAADGQFFSWLGQAEWLKRFESRIEILNFLNMQLANDRLFPLEQMAVGGRYSVRGYRENTLLRDNAFVYQFETRFPVWSSSEGFPYVQFCPFADVGHSWSAKGASGDPQTLASVGAGLRFNITTVANLNVYWGRRLVMNNVSNPHNSMQDEGVHIQFVLNVM
jgi:hemolysin activation/secretion protein